MVSLLGSLLALFVAYASKALLCVDEGEGVTCRTGLFTGQLLAAVVGVVIACALAYSVFVAKDRWYAILSLLLLIAALLAFGLMNDAAVHGWDELKVF